MMERSILIVDDDVDLCHMLAHLLRREGLNTQSAHDVGTAIKWLMQYTPAVVLMDVRLPDASGLEAIQMIQQLQPDIPIIIISAYAGVTDAVGALKAGAYDYLPKPFDNAQVVRLVRQAIAHHSDVSRTQHEPLPLSSQSTNANELTQLMGPSMQIETLAAELFNVASTDYSVIIQGETGTGKELVARYLHRHSRRCDGPFVAIDCGAAAENLLENELFGHEKGAYTGADRQQIGRFESACGGTLFLDEISNLSFNAQALLLRALQERTIHRLGGNKDIDIDVRIIVASNQDLKECVRMGTFREDLLYRLDDYSVLLPALRQRQSDIIYLSKRFLQESSNELHKDGVIFTSAAEQKLLAAQWPGNVRQLRSVVRRTVLQVDNVIDADDLKIAPLEEKAPSSSSSAMPQVNAYLEKELSDLLGQNSLKNIIADYSEKLEVAILTRVLTQTGGNKAEAARLLHVDYKTIHSKIKKLGISADRSSITSQKVRSKGRAEHE